MGKIPVFVIPIVAVVLIGGFSFAAHKMMVAPRAKTLADKQKELDSLKQKAAQLEAKQRELEQVKEQWQKAQEDLQQLQKTRSIPVSFALPVEAMIALTYELRHDLGPVLTQWIESSGCEITSSVALPGPPGSPPAPPPSGFYPIATNLTITVRGSLEQIEKLYNSLSECPRVLTIGGLSLQPEGDTMVAQVPLNVYLLVETPPSAAAAPAAAGGMGAPGAAGGMMGGFGGMGMGGMGGMGPGGAPGAPGMMGPQGPSGGGLSTGGATFQPRGGGGEQTE